MTDYGFMSNILIVTGGEVDYVWAREWLSSRRYDFVIAADSGLEHAKTLGLKVDYILGDYDSVHPELLEVYKNDTEIVVYPKDKDFTDTHLAILSAINKGAENIDVIGATGSRMDHMLTNVSVCRAALDAMVNCCLYDAHNKIYLLDKKMTIEKEAQYGSYVSVIPMTEKVLLSLSGFKYPLDNYELKQGLSICQSNEIKESEAVIDIKAGTGIVIEARD